MTRNPLRRLVFENGLRVLLAPNDVAASIGLAVHYGVGFRTEPPGGSGLAHLFEHLVFQGGEHVPAGGYIRCVQEVGGLCDARTRQDVTIYHSTAPAFALEALLELEADRMRYPRINGEAIRSQLAVIEEEVSMAVRNRPYGQSPWALSRLLHSRAENRRDGYGETLDLAGIDVDTCTRFFADHYAPGNALVTLTGAFDPEAAEELLRRRLGDVPARPFTPAPDLSEPPPEKETLLRIADPHARAPAVALAQRLPDPATELPAYLAHLALVALLVQGRRAPLRRRLEEEAGVAGLSMGCGLFGQPLDTAGPDVLTFFAVHDPAVAADRVLGCLEAELDVVADSGVDPVRLRHTTARWAASALRELGDPGARAQLLGLREMLFGQAELTERLPELMRQEVTPDLVREAAAGLRTAGRAVVLIEPNQQGR